VPCATTWWESVGRVCTRASQGDMKMFSQLTKEIVTVHVWEEGW
jgi:hypothetical protein